MSLCYIIIIILSAYNVTNKAEQCPNKSIFKNNVALITLCYLIVMFPIYVLIVTCDASILPCYKILLIFLVSYP